MASKKWAEEEESSDEEVEKKEDEPERRPQQGTSGHAAPARYQQHAQGLTGYMTSINFRAKLKDIEDFLWDNSCHVADVDMIPDPTNPRRFGGKAKIYFKDEASLEQFLTLNDSDFMERKIGTKVWSEERPPPRDSYRFNDARGGGGGEYRDNRGDRRPYRQDPPRGGGRGDYRDNNRDRGERRPRGGSGENFRNRRRDEHDDRDNHHAPIGDNAPNTIEGEFDTPEEKTERRRIQLAPRTKPIEEIGKLDRKAAIFGEGSAHDEFEYEKRRKERDAAAVGAQAQPSTIALDAPASTVASPPPAAPATAAVADGCYAVQPPAATASEDDRGGFKEVSSSRTRQRGGQQGNNSAAVGRGSYKGAAGGTSTDAHTNSTTAKSGGDARGGRGGSYSKEGGGRGGEGRGRGRDRERRPSSAANVNITEGVQSSQIDQDAALARQLANNPISPVNPTAEEEGFITVDRKKKLAAVAPVPSTAVGGKGAGDSKKRPSSSRGDGPSAAAPRTNNKDRAERSERPASVKGGDYNSSKTRGNGTVAIAAAAIKDATVSSAAASAKSVAGTVPSVPVSKQAKQQGGMAGLSAESDDE